MPKGAFIPPPPPGEAQTYWFSFPETLTRLRCPVEKIHVRETIMTNLWVNFAQLHVRDSIVIL